jgi:dTDP-D-glucose 4,6-dehydratase
MGDIVVDALTCAGSLDNLADVSGDERLSVAVADVWDAVPVDEAVAGADVRVGAAAGLRV